MANDDNDAGEKKQGFGARVMWVFLGMAVFVLVIIAGCMGLGGLGLMSGAVEVPSPTININP